MAHDLIIRNGTIIDGTGAPGYVADLAINGDRITAIGNLAGEVATKEIDATGQIVSPGFIDLHTHLDAQVGWDPYMTSSSWHGVTTVLMGNCGVTFAPVRPDDRQFLAEMMESVEDIPRDAILDGLPWDWETYPEYLDSVQRLQPALNIVGMVGHCAVRYHVMGERSLSDEPATASELNQMRDIAEESVAGGAVGFSTSRILLHVVPDGRYVPGTLAPIDEYLAVADGMNAAGGGLFQAVNDFATRGALEATLLKEMASACGDVLFSGGVGNSGRGGLEFFGSFLDEHSGKAGRITSASMTRPSGSLCGLAQISPVKGKQWKALMALPTLADRVAALKDPATRALLAAEGYEKGMWYDPNHIYPLGTAESPDYSEANGVSIAEHAARLRTHDARGMAAQVLHRRVAPQLVGDPARDDRRQKRERPAVVAHHAVGAVHLAVGRRERAEARVLGRLAGAQVGLLADDAGAAHLLDVAGAVGDDPVARFQPRRRVALVRDPNRVGEDVALRGGRRLRRHVFDADGDLDSVRGGGRHLDIVAADARVCGRRSRRRAR